MSWLSEIFGGGGGEDPLAVYQRQQAERERVARLEAEFYAQEAEKERQRLAAGGGGAVGEAHPGSGLLAPGFESTYIPDTLTAGPLEDIFGKQRSKAQDYINTLFSRGGLTQTGRQSAESALTGQEAGVRNALGGIGKTLLENERAKLRGLAGTGTPTDVANVANESSAFQASLPAAFAGAVPGDLFTTASLGPQGGAVSGEQTAAGTLDPYAAPGGQLRTGLEEGEAAPPPSKKRTTSVF